MRKGVFVVGLFIFNISFSQVKPLRPSRPNVLFIMVDDLRPELACYGKSFVKSPNIDRLAKMGQLFINAYVNYPVCGPSRASLLSGIYPSRTRFNEWNCSQDNDVPGIVSLPMLFRNNNYKTISLGKVYNNFEDGKGSWDEIWEPSVSTSFWDWQTKEGISIFDKVNAERDANTNVRNNKNLPNRSIPYEKADVSDITYMDGRIADKAIETLQKLQNTSEAFFLAVGFHKPHLPFNAPGKYWDLYDNKNIPLAQNPFRSKKSPSASLNNYEELRFYYGIPKNGSIPDSLAQKLIHGYFACVSYVDAQIGKVLDELENIGLEKNTIVVLWGDHGWHLGENALWAKNSSYMPSLRIPLIVKTPGNQGDIRQTGLVESVDIYPTLCDLVGLDKPFQLQGKSFASLLDNPGQNGKEEIFCRAGKPGLRGDETIITKTYSYTEFYDSTGHAYDRMLFDLNADPLENVNIAVLPENNEVMLGLSKKLKEHIHNRDIIILNK